MTKHGRRILLKTRGFLGRLVAVFAGTVMLLTNVPAVNADNADKRDRITAVSYTHLTLPTIRLV